MVLLRNLFIFVLTLNGYLGSFGGGDFGNTSSSTGFSNSYT